VCYVSEVARGGGGRCIVFSNLIAPHHHPRSHPNTNPTHHPRSHPNTNPTHQR
jgi:hypothetical protein